MIDLQVINDNVWVFLSHSHNDYDKVIQVRNMLERRKFKPLMFFLKAFEKPEYEPMLKPILMEEIDQRDRFILCRSDNSRKSEWVKFEEDNIKSKKRPFEVIDLDSSDEIQLEAIKNYRRRSRVFISSSCFAKDLVQLIKKELNNHGFSTTWNKYIDLPRDTDVKSKNYYAFKELIDNAKEGYVLYLLNSNCINRHQVMELNAALQMSSRIITIWISGEDLPSILMLGGTEWTKHILDVRALSQVEQVRRTVEHLIEYDLQFNGE